MTTAKKSTWVYLLAGGIIAAFVGGLIFLSQQDSGDNLQAAAEAQRKRNKDTREVREDGQQNPANAPSAPELSFYNMLPELEVMVSPELDVSIGRRAAPSQPPASAPRIAAPRSTPRTAPAKPPVAPPAASTERYYLQVGAFSHYQGADRQKASLLLNNWPTRIQQARRADGSKIYRVFVGPYSRGAALDKATQQLKQQGLQPVRSAAG